MLQLIHCFLSENWEVHFGSTASKNQNSLDLSSIGVKEYSLELNSSSFDELISVIEPTMVVFDRFMTEEQFGWRVTELVPGALKILDTEDLHSLRKTRQECLKKEIEFSSEFLLNSEIAKREIASIYRCDLSIMISSFEMDLLINTFQIPDTLLCHLPFCLDPITEKQQMEWPSFEERAHFVSIGNFLHAPNLDATLQLKKEIWPRIRKQLPTAQLHVYGAYPSQQVLQLHNEKEGFIVDAFVENADEVIANSKVLLAPLRFGGGLKGKLIQAMFNGTPSVTTEIGAEAMHDGRSWAGFIENDIVDFVRQSVKLYTDDSTWKTAQDNGVEIVNTLYNKEKHENQLIDRINNLQKTISQHRKENFIGRMLQHHSMNSYKYLSKWIEEKNKTQN